MAKIAQYEEEENDAAVMALRKISLFSIYFGLAGIPFSIFCGIIAVIMKEPILGVLAAVIFISSLLLIILGALGRIFGKAISYFSWKLFKILKL